MEHSYNQLSLQPHNPTFLYADIWRVFAESQLTCSNSTVMVNICISIIQISYYIALIFITSSICIQLQSIEMLCFYVYRTISM